MTVTGTFERISRRANPQRVPRPLGAHPDLMIVDATWGTVAPIEIAPGVRTVGELEVIDHVEAGRPLVDTRPPEAFALESIPGAVNLSWHEETELVAAAPAQPAVYFCNGPQCTATPGAIAILLAAGHPPEWILYYRGGLHDWMTLGFPVEPGS
jgi:rhodanese-related sulfurtransferase